MQRIPVNDLKRLKRGKCIVSIAEKSVYRVKVPMVQFSQSFMDSIGEPQINHSRRKFVRGLNLYADAPRWLS